MVQASFDTNDSAAHPARWSTTWTSDAAAVYRVDSPAAHPDEAGADDDGASAPVQGGPNAAGVVQGAQGVHAGDAVGTGQVPGETDAGTRLHFAHVRAGR